MKPYLLCDVDGCVADLMGGFARWLDETFYLYLDKRDIDRHKLADCTNLSKIDFELRGAFPAEGSKGGIVGAFNHFMAIENVYMKYVSVIPGAKDAFETLSNHVNIVFVTANMSNIPQSFVSKYWWLKGHFPGIPIFTAPSEMKQMVTGKFAVDDRYDICKRWQETGVQAMCFGQPWSELPQYKMHYNWHSVCEAVQAASDVNEKIKGGYFGGEF